MSNLYSFFCSDSPPVERKRTPPLSPRACGDRDILFGTIDSFLDGIETENSSYDEGL
jgi:hypothetical protein